MFAGVCRTLLQCLLTLVVAEVVVVLADHVDVWMFDILPVGGMCECTHVCTCMAFHVRAMTHGNVGVPLSLTLHCIKIPV